MSLTATRRSFYIAQTLRHLFWNTLIAAASLFVAFLVYLVWVAYLDSSFTPPPLSPAADQSPRAMQAVFPRGDGRFDVVQPSEVWPKIAEVRLNPPQSRLGAVQRFAVTVKSRVPVVSVVTLVETDRGTVSVKLAPRGNLAPDPEDASLPRYGFDGEWKTSDVRTDVAYHLTFIANDERGRASTATFAWSAESDE